MAKATTYKTIESKGAKRAIAIIDYDSMFTESIEDKIKGFNMNNPEEAYDIHTYKASELGDLAEIDEDKTIHTGGQGKPVNGSKPGSLYICHSHQWKAEKEGGKVEHLADYQKGIGYMEVKEDDPVIGEQGHSPIEKYHTLAVTEAPKNAKVIATSKQTLEGGREVETAEAIRYDDDSISIQGHPGGKTPSNVLYNFLKTQTNGYKKAA